MVKATGNPAKPMGIWGLLTFLWVGGLFSSLLWSPVFVADAIEQSKLAKLGVDTWGTVESQGRGRRRNSDYFWATVVYEVDSKKHSSYIQGDGAAASRLPLGAAVKVRYLPNRPSFSVVHVDGASSGGGPGWTGLFILWGVTVLSAIGAYFVSRRKRSSSKCVKRPTHHSNGPPPASAEFKR